MHRYINEGNDVTTAADFRDAMLSSGGINGVQVALIDHSELQHLLSTQGKWDGISTLNNFLFEEENVTVCKAFEVGSGKTILWSKLPGNLVIECDK